MKISIITIIDNANSGSYLQAYALAKTLELLGHEPEIIHYTRPSRDVITLLKKTITRNTPWHWPGTWLSIFKKFKGVQRYQQFIQMYLSKKHYVGYRDIKKNPPRADVYITGSDQVWNSEYNKGVDRSFFLDFAPAGTRRIAYAASIGMQEIPDAEKAETKELLERFSAISMREKSGKQLIEALGIDHQKVSVTLDPTLLLSKEQWNKECETNPEKRPYLLVYIASKFENETYKSIKSVSHYIADSKKLNIVVATFTDGDFIGLQYDSIYKNVSLQMFLTLLMGASFVVAYSFHGTAFAVNFKKDFVTVMPDKYNSRINDFLEMLDLQQRRFTVGQSETSQYLKTIEYSKVDEKLSQLRNSSLTFLKENLLTNK